MIARSADAILAFRKLFATYVVAMECLRYSNSWMLESFDDYYFY